MLMTFDQRNPHNKEQQRPTINNSAVATHRVGVQAQGQQPSRTTVASGGETSARDPSLIA